MCGARINLGFTCVYFHEKMEFTLWLYSSSCFHLASCACLGADTVLGESLWLSYVQSRRHYADFWHRSGAWSPPAAVHSGSSFPYFTREDSSRLHTCWSIWTHSERDLCQLRRANIAAPIPSSARCCLWAFLSEERQEHQNESWVW